MNDQMTIDDGFSSQIPPQNIGLITIEEIDGEPRVDSRLISQELGIEHKHTLEMIRKYRERFERYGKVAFKTAPSLNPGSCQNVTVGYLNEQQSTFLVTLSRNSEQAVDLKQKLTDSYYHYKNQFALKVPTTYAEALQLAADQAKKIEEDRPKVEYFERVADSDGLHAIGEAAKILNLGYGRNTFFVKLREMGIMMKDKTVPYQKYVDQGYFELKQVVVGSGHIKHQAYVTGKGMIWLERQFKIRAV